MKKLTPEQVESAAALIGQGEASIRSLAEEYGVNESTLRRRLPDPVRRAARTGAAPQQVSSASRVEVPLIVRDYRHMESLRVYPIGDLHVGSRDFHERKLEEWLEFIATTAHASMLNTGDNLNAAIVGSKSDVYTESRTVDTAMDYLEDRLRPIAEDGRLDALTGGNHEARIYRATGIDPMHRIARTLGVPHFEGAAVVRYLVGDQRYHFYVRHGTGNSPQSMAAITKSGHVMHADVYLTGHTHRQSVVLEDFFDASGDTVVRLSRYYVTSASFVQYERYAAERGYAPSHLGAPRIFLDGTRKDVHVSV